ncbi:Choline dehydrogenase [Paracoccus halophilus]|uniref:Choline dehydrogenase n=1 Tax=Paracoccus halophilus TaxID=376733 RepID=A0A099F221_9RHOB|nr:GMC family oxidoreductase [Paracoccus halophilus]KGJ04459.1 glucose-methanol-choline oxidoreductase [Paracoccus halophilus]SFA54324.1 Choline dehydrogenase [Paracoccus halophilus]
MDDLTSREWDAIVIGTGVGGGSVGRSLAEAGLSVLFVEKGPDLGDEPPMALEIGDSDPAHRLARGAWPRLLEFELDGRQIETDGMVGAAVGGTSIYYAATLERPERHDLEPVEGRPHPTGGWVVGHDAFRPWFEAAERNFHINGEIDPLASERGELPPPLEPLPASDAALIADLRRTGMHPYRTHMATRLAPASDGAAPQVQKMHGRSAGVTPALKTGRAALIDRCTVTRIEADGRAVTGLTCLRDGQSLTLRARRYVLSAGGLGSPTLMLRSASEYWPGGLGNRHDLVGRNLMFHLSEILALWTRDAHRDLTAMRSISMRDLYYMHGQRFGTVQSMGLTAGYGEILYAMQKRFDLSSLRRVRMLRHGLRIPAVVATRAMGKAKLFVGVLEDLPYSHNRVLPDPDDGERLRFHYHIADELHQRRAAFRAALRRAFQPHRAMFTTTAPELNFAHPCGTLRFGKDEKASVLDADCRVHGLENLYVADSSFMPTSNGVNPSLTIAANALRVGARIAAEMQPRLAAVSSLGY